MRASCLSKPTLPFLEVAIAFGTSVILAYLALWRLRTSTPVGGGRQPRVFKLPSGSIVSILA